MDVSTSAQVGASYAVNTIGAGPYLKTEVVVLLTILLGFFFSFERQLLHKTIPRGHCPIVWGIGTLSLTTSCCDKAE